MYIKKSAYIEKAASLAEGEVEFIVSTKAWDAHGERIDVDGIQLKDFKKNPVVLWAHDGFNLPIAKATKIWKDGDRLMARAKFYMKDEFPRRVYQYIVDGFLNAVSIGGQVEEWAEDGMTISKLNMKEFSVVSVPANQEALVAAKSMDKQDKSELQGLARTYARKVLTDNTEDDVIRNIRSLKSLVAALEEVAVVDDNDETDEVQAKKTIQVVLRKAQAVDQQAEKTIRSIKLKGKNNV